MNNKEKHIKIKKLLKIGGLISLILGLVFDIIGFVSIFSSFGSFSAPKNIWCLFIGFPLTAIGIGMLAQGFHRELMTYHKNETVPIINEAVSELKPSIKVVTESIGDILDDNGKGKVLCECGAKNLSDDNYCKNCGKNLNKLCYFCGESITNESKFCSKCGKRV